MGSGPKISKLRKAIKRGSTKEIVNAMFNLKFREDKSTTHGENIRKETKRAVTQLKFKCNLERVKRALEVAKEHAGEAWIINPSEVAKLANKPDVTEAPKLAPDPNSDGVGGLKLSDSKPQE